jgi:predicted ATPase/tRNA A-37 threonylcarbamoyl transferase component Bud32
MPEMATEKDRWEKIDSILNQALELPEEKRAGFLNKECGNDEALRNEIESLLSFDQSSGTLFRNIQENVVPAVLAGLLDEVKNESSETEPAGTGQNIAHYTIIEKLGSGGMGAVFKARDTKLDRYVALKFLTSPAAHRKHHYKKLLKEAKAAAALNHPNIATIYEINETDEQFFIAMEFIDGVSLREVMRSGPLEPQTALNYSVEIAEALREAHEHGVVHHDIKPENIMVLSNGRIKVMDFGLAVLNDSIRQQNPGSAAGTPHYMSPEAVRREQTDHRADLWSLGVVMYEMIAGVRPFGGEDVRSIFEAVLNHKQVPLSERVENIPPELSEIIAQLLQKDPAQRFDSAGHFLKTCREFIGRNLHGTDEKAFRVPKPLTGFIGRKKELSGLKKRLKDSRLITLTGVAGSGKTRLAVELAHNIHGSTERGIYFIDLSSIRNSDLVASAILRALNLKEHPEKSIPDVIVAHLHAKNLILILDNFEQVLDAAPELAEIIRQSPGCRFLVTSREPLHIQGEQVFQVPPLLLPGSDSEHDLKALKQVESVALFVERAKQVKPDFELSQDNVRIVASICRQLDGLPLAIELAAVRIRILTPNELLERLNDRFRLLSAGTRDLPERQQSLRTAIEWSYDLLSETEKVLFRRLAIFSGGFTLKAADAVCNKHSELYEDVLNGITSLHDKNLVYSKSESKQSMRFNMLESIREFAAEQLSQSGEYVALRDNHRNYYVSVCVKLHSEITGSVKTDWLDKVNRDYENFIMALEWKSGLEEEVKNSLILTNVLWRFWLRKCLFNDGRKRIRESLNQADESVHTVLVAELRLGAGTLAHNNGDYDDALKQISESLRLYRLSGNREGIAKALTNLGWVRWRLGDYRLAREFSEEALATQQQMKDDSGVAYALNNLGWIALHQGEFLAALDYHQQSLSLRRTLKDKRNIAFSSANCGWANHKLGRFDEAEMYFDESLELFSEVEDRQLYTFTSCLKAELLADTGRMEEAHGLLMDEIVPSFKKIEDTYGYAFSLNCLGTILFREKNYSGALKQFEESRKVRLKLGDKWGVAQALCAIARTKLHSDSGEIANEYLAESYTIRRDLDDKYGLLESIEVMAEYFFSEHSKETAISLYRLSVQLRKRIGAPRYKEKDTIFCRIEQFVNKLQDSELTSPEMPEFSSAGAVELLREADRIIRQQAGNRL